MSKMEFELKNGKKIMVNVPSIKELDPQNPSDVSLAETKSHRYGLALTRQALTALEIGVETLDILLSKTHVALGYQRIEDWAKEKHNIGRRSVFYYKYLGILYYKLVEVMPELFSQKISHTKLLIAGDAILAENNTEKIREHVQNTLVLDGGDLHKLYHPKEGDDFPGFRFTGTLKNIQVQYNNIEFHWDKIYPKLSSETYFTTWGKLHLEVTVKVIK